MSCKACLLPSVNSFEALTSLLPLSMFGHSCCWRTVALWLLSLLQLLLGRSQRGPQPPWLLGLPLAGDGGPWARWRCPWVDVTPYIPTPLSRPLHLRSQQDSTSREGLVGAVKRGREGTPCPHFTLPPSLGRRQDGAEAQSFVSSYPCWPLWPQTSGAFFLFFRALLLVSFCLCAGALVWEVLIGSFQGN